MNQLNDDTRTQIRELVPINGLPTQHQRDVIERSEIVVVKKRQLVFKEGDKDDYHFYLLEGELELYSNGQLVKTLVAGAEAAKHPMAQLQPRQLSARAITAARILRIDRQQLEHLLNRSASDWNMTAGPLVAKLQVEEVKTEEDEGVDWMSRMLQSDLFTRIPPMNIQQIFAHIEEIEVSAGTVIIEQGAQGDFYYVIRTGRCDIIRNAGSGKQVKLAELKDGDSFGEEALVSNAKRNATVVMMTDGTLMRLTKEHFIDLIKEPSLNAVDYVQACALVQQGAVWLDVRFPDEFEDAAISGSINLPLIHLRTQLDKLQKDCHYVVCCDSGTRSASAAFLLMQRGYEATLLEGGLAGTDLLAESEIKMPSGPPSPSRSQPDSSPKARSEPEAPVPAALPLSDRAPGDGDAEIELARLRAEMAKAERQMEEAIRAHAQAEAARRQAAVDNRTKLEAEKEKLRVEVRQAMEQRLITERRKLEEQAREANQALGEAKRLKKELATAQLRAKQRAEARRKAEQAELVRLKQASEARLKDEREKLEAEYARQAEELVELQRQREETPARLEHERAKLAADAAAAKEAAKAEADHRASEAAKLRAEHEDAQATLEATLRAEAEAKLQVERQRLVKESERKLQAMHKAHQSAAEAKQLADRQALQERLHTEAEATLTAEKKRLEDEEQRMRAAAEERLKAERSRLEAEFARSQQELNQAQSERLAAEEARKAAQAQAQLVIDQQRAALEATREKEETKLRVERQRLGAEAEKLRRSVEAARKAKEEAEAATAEAKHQAGQKLVAAEAAHRRAQADHARGEAELKLQHEELDSLRRQVAAELEEWLATEASGALSIQLEEEQPKKAKPTDEKVSRLFDDVAAQLTDDPD